MTYPQQFFSLEKRLQLFNQIESKMQISITNKEGIITYVNKLFCESIGYTEQELIGNTHSIIKHPDNGIAIYKEIWDKISKGEVFFGKLKNRTKNRKDIYHIVTIIPFHNSDENTIYEYVSIRQEIDLHKTTIDYFMLRTHSKITGLKNRLALLNRISKIEGSLFMAFIDVNKFRDINNYYGNEFGDKILIQIAQRGTEVLGDEGFYNIGGDVFCFLKVNEKDYKLEDFKNFILKMTGLIFRDVFILEEHDILLEYTIGIAIGDSSNIIEKSNIALSEAKDNNRVFSIFSPTKHEKSQKKYKEDILITKEIKDALSENRVVPFFQPIYDNNLRKITKYECLARIRKRNSSEYLSPAVFISVAQKTKLIYELTKVIFLKSLEAFKDYPNLEFSINLTVNIILNEEMTEFIYAHMLKYNNPNRVIFELVEDERIPHDLFTKDGFISKLKEIGCKFALDDFGCGYSNLKTFADFGYDYVKLDGSLISMINTLKGFTTVETIVNVAHKNNVSVVAEWVTDEDTLKTVKKLRIDYSQGFYFGKPQEQIIS